jgi:hypothetical protein
MRMPERPEPAGGLLSLRTAFVLLLAVLAAGIAALLTWVTRRSAAEAALAGLTVLAAGIKFFDWLIT